MGTARGAVRDDVTGRTGVCVRRGAAQVGRGRAGDRGRDIGFGRISDRGLERLVGNRLCAVDQLNQRGDAGVGGLEHLHAVGNAIEQIVDVAGAVVERLGREEVGGVVERRVHLLASRQTGLGGGEQVGGGLEGEQVLTNRGGENDTGHDCYPSGSYASCLTEIDQTTGGRCVQASNNP